MDVYLARQPVFDGNLNAIAYELLFRGGLLESAIFDDPAKASGQVLVNAFSEIGLEKITRGKPALVNIPQQLLVAGGLPIGLQKVVILELLEDVVVNNDVIRIVKSLVELGYRIALDDFEFADAWRPLIPLASYIKLDVMSLGKEGVAKQLDLIRGVDRMNAKLIAEKVETHDELLHYKKQGFDYYQGYFLCRPHVMADSAVPASQMVINSLLGELANEDYDVDRVSKILSQDPRLSYKLLRVVNSAAFGLSRTIKTVEDTVVLLGSYELRRWASMLAMFAVDNKPHELMITAMVRAKFCELVAKQLGRDNSGSYFMAGLLSMLDAMLDRPLTELLPHMPLSAELEIALLTGGGDIGSVLKAVAAYDCGKFEQAKIENIDTEAMAAMYLETLTWADVSQHAMVSREK